MADHDHTIDTGKGTFSLEDLGPLMPGMAEVMPLVGSRIWKCYYAGKAGNRPLAAFQLKEAVNLMEKGAFLRPKYVENMHKFIDEEVAAVGVQHHGIAHRQVDHVIAGVDLGEHADDEP